MHGKNAHPTRRFRAAAQLVLAACLLGCGRAGAPPSREAGAPAAPTQNAPPEIAQTAPLESAPNAPPASARDAPPGGSAPPCSAALCNISQSTWRRHIEPRHCTGECPPKSIFSAEWCGGRAGAVAFCQALMEQASCAGTVQANGNVAYTADLGTEAGRDRDNRCGATRRGTVVYDPTTGRVITQFPGNP